MLQARAKVTTRILWLQSLTIAWMSVECGVAIYSAVASHSEVLLVFGADSFVELLSAALVLVATFSSLSAIKERATRATGLLLFLLAGLILLTILVEVLNGVQPAMSLSGIAITAAALIVMPVLAWVKRRTAKSANNRALAADAVQSVTCFYLAGITLVGLLINAAWHFHWVDSVAALAALPLLIVEGRRALRGEACGCS